MDTLKFLFDPMYFFKQTKRILDSQIEVFLDAGREGYREWLELFAQNCLKSSISEVEESDVESYLKLVYTSVNTQFAYEQAAKSIRQLRKYYMARSKNLTMTGREGRPPAVEKILRAHEYKAKGLRLTEIAKLLDSDPALVHRWLQRDDKYLEGLRAIA